MYLIWYILLHFARAQFSNFRFSADVFLVSSPHSFVFFWCLSLCDPMMSTTINMEMCDGQSVWSLTSLLHTRRRDEYRLLSIPIWSALDAYAEFCENWKTWHMILVLLLAYIHHDLLFPNHFRCICIVLFFEMIRPRQLWIILQCSM